MLLCCVATALFIYVIKLIVKVVFAHCCDDGLAINSGKTQSLENAEQQHYNVRLRFLIWEEQTLLFLLTLAELADTP
jgi:hypothetical protein